MTAQLPKVGIRASQGQSLEAIKGYIEAVESHLDASDLSGHPVDPREFSLLASSVAEVQNRLALVLDALESEVAIPHARTRAKALASKVQGLLDRAGQVQALLGLGTNLVRKRVFPSAQSRAANDRAGGGGRVVDGALVKDQRTVTGQTLEKMKDGASRALSGALQASDEALADAIVTFNEKGLVTIESNVGGATVNGLSLSGSDSEGNPLSVESLVAESEGGTKTLLGPSINGQGNEWSNKDLAFAPVRAKTLTLTLKGKPNGKAFLKSVAPKLYEFVGDGVITEGEHSFGKPLRSVAIAESSTGHDLSRYFEVIHTVTVDGQGYDLSARDDEWGTLPKLLWLREGGTVSGRVLRTNIKGDVTSFRHRASIKRRESLDEAALEALLGHTAKPRVVELPAKTFKASGYTAPPLRLSTLQGALVTGWGINRIGVGMVIPETLEIKVPPELVAFVERGQLLAYVGGNEIDIEVDGTGSGSPSTGARLLKGPGDEAFLKFAVALKGETFCPRVNVPTHGTLRDGKLSLAFPGCFTGLRGEGTPNPLSRVLAPSEGLWANVSDPKATPIGPTSLGQTTLGGASTFLSSASLKVILKDANLVYLEALGESGIYEVALNVALPTTIEGVTLRPAGRAFERKVYRADGATLTADYTFAASALSGRCLMRLPRAALVPGFTIELLGKNERSKAYAVSDPDAVQVGRGEVLLGTLKSEVASASLRNSASPMGVLSWALPDDAIAGTVTVKDFEMLSSIPEREALPLLELLRHSQTTASGLTTTRFLLPSSYVDVESLVVRRLDTGEVLPRTAYDVTGFNLYVESTGGAGIAEVSVQGEVLYLPPSGSKVAWVEGRTVMANEPMTVVTYQRHPYEVYGHHAEELGLKKSFEDGRLMVFPSEGSSLPDTSRAILFFRGYSKDDTATRPRAVVENGTLTLLPSYFVLECHFA